MSSAQVDLIDFTMILVDASQRPILDGNNISLGERVFIDINTSVKSMYDLRYNLFGI
jgi:hypothetical protein